MNGEGRLIEESFYYWMDWMPGSGMWMHGKDRYFWYEGNSMIYTEHPILPTSPAVWGELSGIYVRDLEPNLRV